ncbi:MAG TPA: glycosyltransferase family 2 protein [Acetobacteraceae bacterium]
MTEIWLYTMSLNEERMLPFFFRHYDRWVDRYIVYDDGSTDRTLEMFAARRNVEVRRFERSMPGSFVISATLLQNAAWKEARGKAAWAVITAIDEHLHHPDILGYLASCRRSGVSAIPALGFQMLAERFPDSAEWLADTHRLGAPFDEMNKLSILDPNLIEETNFVLGRHSAEPTGRVVYPEADELVNLHYKYLDTEYLRSRHALLLGGLGEVDKAAGLGWHYQLSTDRLDAEWRRFASMALDYRDPTVGFTTHLDRWWRGSRRRS